MNGIENKIDPGERSDNNDYTDPLPKDRNKQLPSNLLDALRNLESDLVFKTAFGESFIASYLKLKYQEWDRYSNYITNWELEHTLNC